MIWMPSTVRVAGISAPVVTASRLRVDEGQPAGADVEGRGDVEAAGGKLAGPPRWMTADGVGVADIDLLALVIAPKKSVDAIDVEVETAGSIVTPDAF